MGEITFELCLLFCGEETANKISIRETMGKSMLEGRLTPNEKLVDSTAKMEEKEAKLG